MRWDFSEKFKQKLKCVEREETSVCFTVYETALLATANAHFPQQVNSARFLRSIPWALGP